MLFRLGAMGVAGVLALFLVEHPAGHLAGILLLATAALYYLLS